MTDKSITDKLLELGTIESIDDHTLIDLLDEIDIINDPKIKSFVRSVLSKAESFWIAWSSNIPNVHPPDEYEVGGLILHTKRVFRAALVLLSTIEASSIDSDCLLAAALLHDVTKTVWQNSDKENVVHDIMHPYTVDNFIDWCRIQDRDKGEDSTANSLEILDESLLKITRLIRCSHGGWSPIPETVPVTMLEQTLHIADLIATNVHIIIDGSEVNLDRWILT
jgi:23S rRNA maturation-related 3'-5' exoribonuclease YhaM